MLIKKIGSKLSSSSDFIGFRPRNLAAAIVYVASLRLRHSLPADYLSHYGGVSLPSIYGLSKRIRAVIKNIDNDTT